MSSGQSSRSHSVSHPCGPSEMGTLAMAIEGRSGILSAHIFLCDMYAELTYLLHPSDFIGDWTQNSHSQIKAESHPWCTFSTCADWRTGIFTSVSCLANSLSSRAILILFQSNYLDTDNITEDEEDDEDDLETVVSASPSLATQRGSLSKLVF